MYIGLLFGRASIVTSAFRGYDPDTLKRLQRTELGILTAIDGVCKKHGIQYFLDSGTALGAVRHQGFIPWDDDSDIGMLRPDYDRFMEIAQDELGDDFVVSSPRTNDRQAALSGKVWAANTIFETQEYRDAGLKSGIFVDVFPYDVLNKDPEIAKKQISLGSRWQKVSYIFHSPSIGFSGNGPKEKAYRGMCAVMHHMFRAFLSQSNILKHFDRAISMGKDNPSNDYVGLSYPCARPFPKEMLLPTRRINFEGHMLPVPNETIPYLEILYGIDWNVLPPEEERKNHAPLVLEFDEGSR